MNIPACLTVYFGELPFDCVCSIDLATSTIAIEAVSVKGDSVDYNKMYFECDGIPESFIHHFSDGLKTQACKHLSMLMQVRG